MSECDALVGLTPMNSTLLLPCWCITRAKEYPGGNMWSNLYCTIYLAPRTIRTTVRLLREFFSQYRLIILPLNGDGKEACFLWQKIPEFRGSRTLRGEPSSTPGRLN